MAEQNLKAFHFTLQTITRVGILTVLSGQNKFHFDWLTIKFHEVLLSFFVFCFFIIFPLF